MPQVSCKNRTQKTEPYPSSARPHPGCEQHLITNYWFVFEKFFFVVFFFVNFIYPGWPIQHYSWYPEGPC